MQPQSPGPPAAGAAGGGGSSPHHYTQYHPYQHQHHGNGGGGGGARLSLSGVDASDWKDTTDRLNTFVKQRSQDESHVPSGGESESSKKNLLSLLILSSNGT